MWDGIEAHARYQKIGYTMVKVLIYSSKEIYDAATYVGRAEADIIAYSFEDGYTVVKDRTKRIGLRHLYGKDSIRTYINWVEEDEWKAEMQKHRVSVGQ